VWSCPLLTAMGDGQLFLNCTDALTLDGNPSSCAASGPPFSLRQADVDDGQLLDQ
jgi:hypothetical protein